MAKAIFKTRSGFTVGLAKLGIHGDGRGTVGLQMHDGDTAIVDPTGNLSVRFLGVDAPEVSFSLPEQAVQADDNRTDEAKFVRIEDSRWEEFLADPFASGLPKLELEDELLDYLAPLIGPGAGTNHATLAKKATDALRDEVKKDMQDLGQDDESFGFFMAFATEVMDGYGRLLGYINCDKKDLPRPAWYNMRLLDQGWATPYFIWPNLDPYLQQPSLVDSVPKPQSALPAGADAKDEKPLDDARKAARKARDDERGVWGKDGPLRLLPFELRFLARRTPPDRWVIDLSAEDDKLLAPQLYPRIEHPEDRLFVPAQYVPLFVEEGWKKVEP